jgi:hypothetical protein
MSYVDLEKNVDHECFICLETCKTPTPCKCHMFVHKDCLQQYLFESQITHCKICTAPYVTPKTRRYTWTLFIVFLNIILWTVYYSTALIPTSVFIACISLSLIAIVARQYYTRKAI